MKWVMLLCLLLAAPAAAEETPYETGFDDGFSMGVVCAIEAFSERWDADAAENIDLFAAIEECRERVQGEGE